MDCQKAAVFLALMSTFILPRLLSPGSYGDVRGGAVDMAAQLNYILSSPFSYLKILLQNIWESLPSYLFGKGVFQMMGHWGTAGFGSVIMIYAVLVIIMEGSTRSSHELSRGQRIGLLPILAMTIGLVWTSMYLTFTVPGSSVIGGVQGRYFIPVLLLIYLLFHTKRIQIQLSERTRNLAVSGISGALLFATVWMQILR